jgi:bifunctional DNA-binding transcriptional regulator/antitoxin component of YhaV-PrlF toxin-antitoxin module
MKPRLDKSGRVVLPKPMGQRTGLRAGATFEATEAAESVLLRPITRRRSLVESGEFLVHTGQTTRGLDWRQLSDDLEQERLSDILGK